ncbi:hypothetical protein GZ77_18105 [Endozoicomonas montiporae]|uniref:Uncharacterized protein n=2 Tax=Endozoicomonas montiporae TaxID=1027273 RepID=A0A081N1W7_9GAMM|nr:hypothetical protein GZ77_18105 [Endozoicomonas montiporae]
MTCLVASLWASVSFAAVSSKTGSKSNGDGGLPVVPCYVEGEKVSKKSIPVNICLTQYKGSPSKSSSYKKRSTK